MTKSYNYLLVGEIMKLMHIIPFIALVIFAGCPQSESQSTKNQPDKNQQSKCPPSTSVVSAAQFKTAF